MTTDFNEIAALAQQLINENGRLVTFSRYDQSPPDPTKPWRGPADPSTVPDATDSVRAVFVGSGSLGLSAKNEDLMKRCEQACLVGPSATFDLATANEIVDNGVHWRIEFVETLKPAEVTCVYVMGLKR